MNEFRMEKHFRSQESFISDIDFSNFSREGFMQVLLELIGLDDSSALIHGLLVKFLIFLYHVLADIAELFLHFLGDFHSVI